MAKEDCDEGGRELLYGTELGAAERWKPCPEAELKVVGRDRCQLEQPRDFRTFSKVPATLTNHENVNQKWLAEVGSSKAQQITKVNSVHGDTCAAKRNSMAYISRPKLNRQKSDQWEA